jgi:hypothetical protein
MRTVDWGLLNPQELIRLTPSEQLALWQALEAIPQLTESQRRLGAIIRGEDDGGWAFSEDSP